MEIREEYLLKRRRLNISMVEIAEALKVSQSMISLYETGKRNFSLVNEYINYIDNKEKEISK